MLKSWKNNIIEKACFITVVDPEGGSLGGGVTLT